MVSWGGTERKGVSLSGSVLDGLVVIDLSGQQLLAKSPEGLDRLRTHFAHEAAHLWMGHTIRYASPSGAWITEGSADLLAIRAVGTLAPGYDMRRALQRAIDDCLTINGTEALSSASARGVNQANYACGSVLMLAAESASRGSGSDGTRFAERLLTANKADGVVTQADWLAAFRAVTGDVALTVRVAEYLDRGAADPAGFFADLFTATSLRFTRNANHITLD